MNKIFVIFLGVSIALISFQCKPANYYEFSHLPQSAFLQLISVLALALFFLRTLIYKKVEIRLMSVYIPVVAFILWAFMSLFWCTNVSEGLAIGLNWLAATIIFFVICNIVEDESDIKWLLIINVIPVVFFIVVGLSQALELPWFSYYPQIVSPAVTFGNKNMMVDAFVSILPSVLLLCLLYTKSFILQILGFVVFGLGLTLILLSDTRAGILAILIQIILLLASIGIYRKKFELNLGIKPFFISLPIILVLLFTLIYFKNEKIKSTGIGQEISIQQFTNRILTIFKTKEIDKWALQKGNQDNPSNVISDSRTMRLVTWQNTFFMFLDKPFTGYGLFNWQIHYGEYRNISLNDPVYRPGMGLYQVHNDYLQLLVDLGVPGFLFALIIFLFNVRSFINVLKQGTITEVKIIIIVGVSMVGILVVSIFSFPFERSVPVTMYFVFTAILTWFNFRLRPQGLSCTKFVSNGVSIILSSVFLCIFVFLLYYQNRRLQAEMEFKSANDQYALGNFELAVQHCQRTLELTPFRHTADLLLGYCYLNLNKNELAEQALLKGLRYYPNDLISLLQLGTTYTKLTLQSITKNRKMTQKTKELFEKSEMWFQKTLAIRSDFHTVYYNKGVLYSQRASFADGINKKAEVLELQNIAIENYQLALKYKPDYVDSMIAIARINNENKNYKEAIPYAENALKLLLENFKKSEQELIQFENNKVSNTSRAFLEMAKNRRKNRQVLIAIIEFPLQILKNYYGAIEINLEKYVEIIHAEETYFLAKEVEVLEQYQYAKDIFERNKSVYATNSNILKSIKAELDIRAADVQKFKLEKQLSTVLLFINKAEAIRLMGKYDQALKILNKAIGVSREALEGASKSHLVTLINFEKRVHLNIVEILCILSTINHQGHQLNLGKFKELAPIIEHHINAGQMAESEPLFSKYKELLERLVLFKKLADQYKTQSP